MDLNDFKRWHWMVVGLLIGLLFGAVSLWSGPAFVTENADSIMQGEFEANVSGVLHESPGQLLKVNRSDEQLTSSARDVVVHVPLESDPPGHLWVTGTILAFTNRPAEGSSGKGPMVRVAEWRPFRFETKSPYVAHQGAPGKYPSVVEYLTALSQKDNLDFSFHYSWWEKPIWTMTLSASVGFLAIGVIWPMILNFLNRAGYGRTQTEQLMKLSSGKRTVKKAKRGNLKELEIEWAIDSTATEIAPRAEDKPAAALVAVLPGALTNPPETVCDQAEKPDPEYRGEFYPVAKTGTHTLNDS